MLPVAGLPELFRKGDRVVANVDQLQEALFLLEDRTLGLPWLQQALTLLELERPFSHWSNQEFPTTVALIRHGAGDGLAQDLGLALHGLDGAASAEALKAGVVLRMVESGLTELVQVGGGQGQSGGLYLGLGRFDQGRDRLRGLGVAGRQGCGALCVRGVVRGCLVSDEGYGTIREGAREARLARLPHGGLRRGGTVAVLV